MQIPDAIFPWERHLLLPYVGQLLEALMQPTSEPDPPEAKRKGHKKWEPATDLGSDSNRSEGEVVNATCVSTSSAQAPHSQ